MMREWCCRLYRRYIDEDTCDTDDDIDDGIHDDIDDDVDDRDDSIIRVCSNILPRETSVSYWWLRR